MNWKSVLNKTLIISLLLHFSCTSTNKNDNQETTPSLSDQQEIIVIDSLEKEDIYSNNYPSLVNIQSLDSTLLVDLKYATKDNFTGKILYKDLKVAYLQKEAAEMLVTSHQYLKNLRPGMRLLIFDALRPLCIQKEMYESVKNTPYRQYVANPERTGLHNYAAAVDITIVDSLNYALDMGTPFDFFGRAAGINNEKQLILEGILTKIQVENRKLLREVMAFSGFQTIRGEWWHFNACSLSEAKRKYELIECF